MTTLKSRRKQVLADGRRAHILESARQVFTNEGLEGASLRAIAAKAGYTAAALYFYFDSKEAIYAELLQDSLQALGLAVEQSVVLSARPEQRLAAAGTAFFNFYAEHPGDLDLGFYLFRGGMKPAGLGRERDERLNAGLEQALSPIRDAAIDLGASRADASLLMVDIFAHATGLLLLLHTGRIRMFGASAARLMECHLERQISDLVRA